MTWDWTEEHTAPEAWSIKDDGMADWAVRKIQDEVAERDRLVSLADQQIEELKQKRMDIITRCDRRTQYLTDHLHEYFKTVKTKETSTTKSYQLLSGKLVQRRQQPEYVRDDDTLTNWALTHAPDLVTVNPSVNWGELKKRTTISGETVVLVDTGEVISGVVAKSRDDIFEVKT